MKLIFSQRPDLRKLDKEIALDMGWKRHGKAADTDSYAGLTCHSTPDGYEVGVVWTKDGVSGYLRDDFNVTEKIKLAVTKENHGKL